MGQQVGQEKDMLGCMGGDDKAKMHGESGLQGHRAIQLGVASSTGLANIVGAIVPQC